MTRLLEIPPRTKPPGANAPSVTPMAMDVSLLTGDETRNSLTCRVGADGPNCHVVHQSYRLSQDIDATCRDLGIARKAAIQALVYHQIFGVPHDPDHDEWQELGLSQLFRHDDGIPTE